jgi:hypothetical protein
VLTNLYNIVLFLAVLPNPPDAITRVDCYNFGLKTFVSDVDGVVLKCITCVLIILHSCENEGFTLRPPLEMTEQVLMLLGLSDTLK